MAVPVIPVKLAPNLGRTHWKRLLAALIVHIRGSFSVVAVSHTEFPYTLAKRSSDFSLSVPSVANTRHRS
jgi:hypothetical protein